MRQNDARLTIVSHSLPKFNYRIKWFDGWENHKLNLDDYNSGPAAP